MILSMSNENNTPDDYNPLDEEDVREIVLAVCGVMFDFGIKEIHIGGLMRLIGVEEEKAQAHDNEIMVLDEEFEEVYSAYVDTLDEETDTVNIERPPNATLH